jgi:hypothetical protein
MTTRDTKGVPMQRGLLALMALLTLSAPAWAQFQVVRPEPLMLFAPPPTVPARVSADDVVDRMMTFDHNNDGKVDKGELAERLHSLVPRGDINSDGALDRFEFHALATAPSREAVARQFLGSSSYGFADQTSFSSRNHIDDSLDDLRLAGPTRERAAAVVKTWVDTLEAAASADLLTQMYPLLTPGQFLDFKGVVDRDRHATRTVTVNKAGEATTRTFVFSGMDPSRRLENYGLPVAEKVTATAAVDEYKARLRLGDAGRSELLAQLEGILSVEERNDLRAALERRPVVATGISTAFGGVVGGVAGSVVSRVVSGAVPDVLHKPVGRVVVQGSFLTVTD